MEESIDTHQAIQRYLDALTKLKAATSPVAARLSIHEFAKQNNVSENLLPVLSTKYKLVSRVQPKDRNGIGYLYKWLNPTQELDLTIAGEVYRQVSTYVRKPQGNPKGTTKIKDTKPEVLSSKSPAKVKAEESTKPPYPSGPLFTLAHLKVLKMVQFSTPTNVRIDDAIMLSNIERLEFIVELDRTINLARCIIKALVKSPKESEELRTLCELNYEGKDFFLDLPYAKKQLDYHLYSVDSQ